MAVAPPAQPQTDTRAGLLIDAAVHHIAAARRQRLARRHGAPVEFAYKATARKNLLAAGRLLLAAADLEYEAEMAAALNHPADETELVA